ncbi:hypothetical protein GW17_00000882 [Ensete ventricosum]|nr:hypothetical protein GW17_00000882 [Ensete ventricosum]
MASSESDSHHMVLRPDKTRVFHLFQLLFRTKLDGHVSIETPIGMEIDWEKRRWAVFISVLLQKILMFIRKPMAWFGSAIEYWLNLVAKNHGFISLVFNILTGPWSSWGTTIAGTVRRATSAEKPSKLLYRLIVILVAILLKWQLRRKIRLEQD